MGGAIHPEPSTQYLLLIVDYDDVSIHYTISLQNIGNKAVDKAHVSVQANVSDSTIFGNGGAVPAGGRLIDTSGQLVPGESITIAGECGFSTPGVVHPQTAGQYLVAMVDFGSQVTELNEANNDGFTQIPIILPDLLISNVSLTTALAGYTTSFIVTNAGKKVLRIPQE